MKFLSTLLLLAGYTLVYAAVANGGKFAYYPWMGVFRDAWGVDEKQAAKTPPAATPTAPNTGGSTKTPRRRTPAKSWDSGGLLKPPKTP